MVGRTFSSRVSDTTTLAGPPGEHLSRLVRWWGLLADFAFGDLLLFSPSADDPGGMLVVGHVRPTTAATLYVEDVIGERLSETERPLVTRALRTGEPVEGEITLPRGGGRARVLCVPVKLDGEVISVLSRESRPGLQRGGLLETSYLGVFRRFAEMIAVGSFPFAGDDTDTEEIPRVGDGVIVLDQMGRIEFASPNATSTMHRMGVAGELMGRRLGELGVDQAAVRKAYAQRRSVTDEVEHGEAIFDVLCVPLLHRRSGVDNVAGAVVIVRDISELRRRDRMLISKDATIREIHHRVKNNLQTISSLLRLQGRRLDQPEAREAIEQSVRRVSSIALVHDALAMEHGDEVQLATVTSDLARMFSDAVSAPERPVKVRIDVDEAEVSARIVTPLAVVLNELLQNVVDHAAGDPEDDTEVVIDVALRVGDDELLVEVLDEGPGIPDDFDIDRARGLGLSIVRTLVRSDLGGDIVITRRDDGRTGSRASVTVPMD